MSQLKKNVFYNALLTTSSLILPFITFPYVTRILAPDGIGQINFANSFIQYFVIISSLGIPYYGIREIAKVRDNIELRSKILYELFIIKLICSLIALIFYLILVFSIPKLSISLPYYIWGLGIIVIGIFDLNYFFSALEDFKYITYRNLFFQSISVILTFVFIKTKGDALIYFTIPIFISLLNTIVNTKYISRFISFKVIKRKIQLRNHLKPLLLLFSIMLFTSIYNLLDTTLLGFLAQNDHVGYYSVASKINRIPLTLIMVLVPVMLPRISMEFKNKNYLEIERLISKTIQFVILIGVPIMVGLYLTAPEIITLISGPEFSPSITTLRILSPVALIIGITTNFSTQLLIPMGKDRQLLYAVISGTLVSLMLNFILIPFLKHNGAAISNLVAEFVVLISCYFFVRKFINVVIPYKKILINLIICIPFAAIVFIARHFIFSTSLIFLISVIFSLIYYIIIQLLFKNPIMLEIFEIVKKKIHLTI